MPDTPQKRTEYDEQAIRTFYISHDDVEDLVGLLTGVLPASQMTVQPQFGEHPHQQPHGAGDDVGAPTGTSWPDPSADSVRSGAETSSPGASRLLHLFSSRWKSCNGCSTPAAETARARRPARPRRRRTSR